MASVVKDIGGELVDNLALIVPHWRRLALKLVASGVLMLAVVRDE